ncbi:hypothetical protein [Muricoccus radiodurans]|uniref:hypothetical protein n=1 Tax=Muricoccus radiodurans TaxID=2231721 RepID=UPI003CEFC9C3
MTLSFPKPLPVLSPTLSAAPPLPCPTARRLEDLTPLLDGAQRALRELEDAARCVPGALAAELFAIAGDAAAEIETVGYDLFLVVGEDAR